LQFFHYLIKTVEGWTCGKTIFFIEEFPHCFLSANFLTLSTLLPQMRFYSRYEKDFDYKIKGTWQRGGFSGVFAEIGSA
jgi:hypothetical protein